MDIIGTGMIAQALIPMRDQHPDTVIFASGVANSGTTVAEAYERESALLYAALQRCTADGRRLVYFSSGGAVYGPVSGPRSESTPVYPVTAYGRHKLLCEAVIRASGARHLILRLANLVGPGQNPHQLIPALVQQLHSGTVRIHAEATRDLLDVVDFARILVDLLAVQRDDALLVTAAGISYPVTGLVTVLEDILQTRAERILIAGGEPQAFDTRRLQSLLPVTFPPDYAEQVLRRYVRHPHS